MTPASAGTPDCRLLTECFILDGSGLREKADVERATVAIAGTEIDLRLDLLELSPALRGKETDKRPYLVQLRASPGLGPEERVAVFDRVGRILQGLDDPDRNHLDLGLDRFVAPNLYVVVATEIEAVVLLTDPHVYAVRRIDPYFRLGPELIDYGAEAGACCEGRESDYEFRFPPKEVQFPVQVAVRMLRPTAPSQQNLQGNDSPRWPSSRLSFNTEQALGNGPARRPQVPAALAPWAAQCPPATGETFATFTLQSEEDLLGLLRNPEVISVRLAHDPQLRNPTVSWIVQTDQRPTRALFDAGLRGVEQIVGLVDGLIDREHCFFADAGVKDRKSAAYRSVAGAPPRQPASLHGTYVAGILAGQDSERPFAMSNGQAPGARLAFRSLADLSGSGFGCSNLYDLLLELYSQDGARILSNSWGDDSREDYSDLAYDVDLLTDRFEDALVVFAASNGSRPKTPENSRNVLAVGAGQQGDDREERGAGPTSPVCDGKIWDPEAKMCVRRPRYRCSERSQPPASAHDHGTSVTVAAVSLREARMKPDIYAPGCWIYSAEAGTGCGRTASLAGTSPHQLEVNCSTSGAAAAVAGAAALVRQYFEHGYYPDGLAPTEQPDSLACTPTGALLKAMLLNGTADMTLVPGPTANRYPSFEEGWGRLLLDKSIYLKGDPRRTAIIDRRHREGLTERKSHRFVVEAAGGQEIKVTLVWTDPAVALSQTGSPVVNDLDLLVEWQSAPAGQPRFFHGNDFPANGTTTSAAEQPCETRQDSINNVEQVVIAEPNGYYEISVWAAEIEEGACQSDVDYPDGCERQDGNQGYALVISGALEGDFHKEDRPNCSLACKDGKTNPCVLGW